MRSPELIQRIQDSMTLLIESSDELRDLDQVLGDGDLGITISAGARAVIEALKAMPTEPEPAPSDVARACAKAFANANPSTMAALVAGGLLAGSKVWVGCEDVTAVEAEAFIRAAASSISHRGKSQVGDKTILDAMVPAVDSLAAASRPTPRLLRTARSRRRPSIAPSPTPPRPWSPPATFSRSAAAPPGCRIGRLASRTPAPPRSCGPSRPGAMHLPASVAPVRRSSKTSEAAA